MERLITVQAATLLAHLNTFTMEFVMQLVPLELMQLHHPHAKTVQALVKPALQLRQHVQPAFQISHIFAITIAIILALQ